MALPADTRAVSAAEVPVADSIRLYAELVCDSASYLVMENRGSRPVTTDAGYRFEQRVHGRWKSVPVRGRDTGRIVLGTRARFDRMCEAETRSRIIDWKRVDLIPDTIRPDGRFVEMTAEVEGASVLVTVRNRTGREIVFGDESDFRLGVFRDGRWMSISYARVVTAVAYPLRPFDTIGRMPHALPYRLYRFEPGRYRIAKEFFFEPDFRRKYVASAEFMLDRWIGCDETGEPEIIIECR